MRQEIEAKEKEYDGLVKRKEDLEKWLAKIRQDAEDLYNKMMKELKLNLEPLEKAKELV